MLNPYAAEFKPTTSHVKNSSACATQKRPSQLIQPVLCPGRDFFKQQTSEINNSIQSLHTRLENLEKRDEQTIAVIKDRLLALDVSLQHLKYSLGFPQVQNSSTGMATLAQTRKDIICVNANIHILYLVFC